MSKFRHNIGRTLAALLFAVAAVAAHAFSPETFADTSVLATGRWVKISVPQDGIYRITAANLRQWGLDPADAAVYGYGGHPLPDVLAKSTYTDDLPFAPQEKTGAGDIVFYGQGPEVWTNTRANWYTATNNPYSVAGYYFVGPGKADPPRKDGSPRTQKGLEANTFWARARHETETNTPGECGSQLVGEDFRLQPKQTFTLQLPGNISDAQNPLWIETSFVCKSFSTSKVAYSVNGVELPALGTDNIIATPGSGHSVGAESLSQRTVDAGTQTLQVGVHHQAPGTVHGAWLNYICVNYLRRATLQDTPWLLVYRNNASHALGGAGQSTRIWDITDVADPLAMDFALDGDIAAWYTARGGMRTYAAFDITSAKLPSPKFEGPVANQNLHADTPVDMVIVSPRQWVSQARRIAGFHTDEGMAVRVVDPEEIYNEFGSGSADPGAIRRYLKMLYDRGNMQGGTPLRHVLLMAAATFDNRHLTAAFKDAAPTLPAWYTNSMRSALNSEEGFGTDDVIAMLADNSGGNRGLDALNVAVGRIPVHSLAEATQYVDKLDQYNRRPKMTGWKSRIMMVADDEDGGVHLNQAESMLRNMQQKGNGSYLTNKVYLDTYRKSGGNYPDARNLMFRCLDEGTAWWVFIGHANNHSMTHDGQLTYNDINNMYLKHVPVLYAATCDFLKWDSATLSGGEIMMHERYGGTMAIISATRPVYIYENGLFTNAMGRHIDARDNDGNPLRLGEIYRRAKNNILNSSGQQQSNTNRLRYVLLGDPAMRMPLPPNTVRVNTINGVQLAAAEDEAQWPVVAARETAIVEGTVTAPDGSIIENFDGTLTATIYDALESVTTRGNGDGVQSVYDRQGGRVFAGTAKIKNGRFSLRAVIPAEIANNMRPVAISMYAVSDRATTAADSTATGTAALNGYLEASGLEQRMFLAGYNDRIEADTVPPVIKTFVMNHRDFADGGRVNTSPMAIAEIEDDNAINLSTAGLGHSMLMVLDGNRTFNDVSQFYTPAADGSPGGTINYPFEDLTPGPHTLTLRVWDADNNAATASLTFNVDADLAPRIYEVYSEQNPATTHANFIITHDRPDQMANVTVTVYNLLGHPLWSGKASGVSDMFSSTPVTWNLCDAAGRRVPRGIYLYRATISSGGNAYETATRRLAVTN